MASTSNTIEAMNYITLDDEENEGLTFEVETEEQYLDANQEVNAELCLVGRFLVDGVIDFPSMQQTMAALWRPSKGVLIKEVDINLYMFQFYHMVDMKRVVDGSPWSFNRKALVIARMKKGDIPRAVKLNNMDLWVQIHDLRPGFMTEKVVNEVGNYVGTFVMSCPSNFMNVWREYLRVRVTVDLANPLKRRMKIRRSGNDWFWIVFKYENVPTFCFICGVLGHSDKFCSQLFEIQESEIVKPYGPWMRAPLRRRRQTKLIGAKWLRDGNDVGRNLQLTLKDTVGGIALLWRNQQEIKLMSYSKNHIDAVIETKGWNKYRLTRIYGEPDRAKRKETWDLISRLHKQEIYHGF